MWAHYPNVLTRVRCKTQERQMSNMLNKSVLLTHQVVLCLYSLGRVTQKHPEYTGPAIGPKMAEKNERNFTEEQIR